MFFPPTEAEALELPSFRNVMLKRTSRFFCMSFSIIQGPSHCIKNLAFKFSVKLPGEQHPSYSAARLRNRNPPVPSRRRGFICALNNEKPPEE